MACSARAARRLLWAVLTVGAACTPEEEDHKVYFTHGDPWDLIAGVDLNRRSFFEADELDRYADYSLSAATVVRQRSDVTDDPTDAWIFKENTPPQGDQAPSMIESYRFIVKDDRVLYAKEPDDRWIFELSETAVRGQLDLVAVSGKPVEPLHYSRSPDGSVFSLLATFREVDPEQEGQVLVALYFTKNQPPIPPPMADTRYHYLLGAGVMARWEDALTINLDPQAAFFDELKQGIERWDAFDETDHKIAGLPFEITTGRQLPFSDVNQTRVMVVDDYLFADRADTMVVAIASTIINPTTYRIAAGSILISKVGLEALGAQERLRTVTHEVGHLLGLHHEFEAGVESIMSYDVSVAEITPHDFEAVSTLYPEP